MKANWGYGVSNDWMKMWQSITQSINQSVRLSFIGVDVNIPPSILNLCCYKYEEKLGGC